MQNHFLGVAEEVGWDLERQIEVLEQFFRDYGVGSRLDDHLASYGLRPDLAFHRQALRDRMLAFVSVVRAEGALSRTLQRAMREVAVARALEKAREEAEAAAKREVVSARSERGPAKRSLFGWLWRRKPSVSPTP